MHTGHAEEFMQYQNTRGGKVVLKPLAVPPLKAPFKRALIDLVYSLKRALTEPLLRSLNRACVQVPDMQFSRVDGTSDALYAFEVSS